MTKTKKPLRPIPGKTFPYKEKLKSIGCKWDATWKLWHAPTEKIFREALAIVNYHPSEKELERQEELIKKHKPPPGIPLTQGQADIEDLRARNERLTRLNKALRQENENLERENRRLSRQIEALRAASGSEAASSSASSARIDDQT